MRRKFMEKKLLTTVIKAMDKELLTLAIKTIENQVYQFATDEEYTTIMPKLHELKELLLKEK